MNKPNQYNPLSGPSSVQPPEMPPNMRNQGVKHDQGKPQFRLIPPKAELEFVKVLTYGANKYAPDNWRNVEAYRYIDALGRHLNAWRSGFTNDSESGLHHLAHVMCCVSFLLEKELDEGLGLDSLSPPDPKPEVVSYTKPIKVSTRWLPQIGDTYYYLSNTGVVAIRTWKGTPQEQKRLDAGHVFKSLKEAQESDHTQGYIFHENDPVGYPKVGDEVWLVRYKFNALDVGKRWVVHPKSYRVIVNGEQGAFGEINVPIEEAMGYHKDGRLFHSKEQAEAKTKWWNMNGVTPDDKVGE